MFFCIIPPLSLFIQRQQHLGAITTIGATPLPRVSRFNAPKYELSLITKQRVSAISRETSSQRRLHSFLFLVSLSYSFPILAFSIPRPHFSSTTLIFLQNTSRTPTNPPATGYIGEFEIIDDHRAGKIVIQLNGRLNKTGVISPRFNIQHTQIESWVNLLLPARGFGIIILVSFFL